MEEKEMLTTEQAQEYLRVSRATFWKVIKKHGVKSYQFPLKGKRVFFKQEDLDKLKSPVERKTEAA